MIFVSFAGESEKCCIDYHHLNPQEKDMEISEMLSSIRSRERIEKELKKCIPICSNCHRKVHKGILNVDIFKI